MIGRRCTMIALGGLLILVLTVNIYFIRMIVESSPGKSNSKNLPVIEPKINEAEARTKPSVNLQRSQKSVTRDMEEKIKAEMRTLPSKYFKQNTSYTVLLDRLLIELRTMPNVRDDLWNIPNNNWPDAHYLIPPAAPELGTIFEALRKAKITRADNAILGTQLKLMLTLEHGVKALFKPQWYSRNTVIEGPVYYGKDRHNAEIVAFHLSSLLALRRVPITVARKLNLREEVIKHATPELYATVYQEGNDTCLYGVCYYCSPGDPVCGSGDILEGALILWLPSYLKLVKHRHPWQRTYRKNKYALWETDPNYCEKVKEYKAYAPQSSSRLLDLVDTAVFDFLMDNGDRHHYELMQNNFHNPAVLLIDNGKSLGNPNVDHFDILAPLYQCCISIKHLDRGWYMVVHTWMDLVAGMEPDYTNCRKTIGTVCLWGNWLRFFRQRIHKTTWDRLKLLSGGSLSISLVKLLAHEEAMSNIQPLITDEHLSAMDRRLLTIYSVVEYCVRQKKYVSSVILDHR